MIKVLKAKNYGKYSYLPCHVNAIGAKFISRYWRRCHGDQPGLSNTQTDVLIGMTRNYDKIANYTSRRLA